MRERLKCNQVSSILIRLQWQPVNSLNAPRFPVKCQDVRKFSHWLKPTHVSSQHCMRQNSWDDCTSQGYLTRQLRSFKSAVSHSTNLENLFRVPHTLPWGLRFECVLWVWLPCHVNILTIAPNLPYIYHYLGQWPSVPSNRWNLYLRKYGQFSLTRVTFHVHFYPECLCTLLLKMDNMRILFLQRCLKIILQIFCISFI